MGVGAGSRAAKVPHVQAGVAGGRQPAGVVKPAHGKKEKKNPLAKYFAQRHRLFHRFDDGVVLDEESWYSVTPEKIAAHIARRFDGREVVVDLFSGAGGNAIQFALGGAFVVGVEKCGRKIELAQKNAKVYGVSASIEFVQGDVYEVLPALSRRRGLIDGIFASPPWGGPGYLLQETFDVGVFKRLVQEASSVHEDFAVLLPRNIEEANVLEHFGPCEIERNSLGGRVKTVTVYFGGLAGNWHAAE